MTLRGFEAAAENPTISGTSSTSTHRGDADSDAVSPGKGNGASGDPALAAVVAAWPALPDPIRRAVLALVGSTTGERE